MAAPLTRTEVCKLLGVSPKTLYLWERDGKVPRPRRDRRGWRSYSSADVAAIRRFLGEEAPGPGPAAAARRRRFRLEGLSARNQLVGSVVSLRSDGLLCEVVLRLGDGQEISSVITARSAERLGLARGQEATAVIKATEVMLFR
jgi:molybdopterin-binding protein